jgi:familyl 116 glycosyl hydrolase-like protein
VRASLDYCMATWDPRGRGVVEEPHHNTYDIEFWGPDGMCTSFYVGALSAAIEMGRALGQDVGVYEERLRAGMRALDQDLYNGEYFFQKVQWQGLAAPSPLEAPVGVGERNYSPEARALLEKEGPKYQYGTGCLSDGILGAWMAEVCAVPVPVDPGKVASHLAAVFRYNFRAELSGHANPQRPTFANGNEGGLLLCTWPRGGKPSLPFVYSDEVWTGIEYQVASHLMWLGRVEEGLEIVRACRARYDGRVRNPFDEYECGHWYARAMSSYAMIEGLTRVRYDAVTKTLHLHPARPGDFRSFLSTASGYGTAGVKDGRPFLDVKSGTIEVGRIDHVPPA